MPTKLTLSIAISALLALAVAAPTQAATVSNTNDSGPGSLRQAIAEAVPGETIAVPAGTYSLSSAPLAIEKSLTLAGKGSAETIIRSVGPFRVFEIEPPALPNIEVTLSDLMIRDGRVFEAGAGGGGIIAGGTNLTLRRVRLTGNIANSNGEAAGAGGVAVGGGAFVISGTLTVVESEVSGNTAEALGEPGFGGGQAQAGGLSVLAGPIIIERSTVSGNIANAGAGQGVANPEQDGGTAAAAGILAVAGTTPSTIVGSTISGNVAEALPGAGGDAGEVVGGGLFVVATKQPFALTNSTIANNVVRNGPSTGELGAAGGVFAVAAETGSVTVTGSTIAANRLESTTPESRGGNLFAAGEAGKIVFRNSIVANGVGPAGSENCILGPGVEIPLVSQGFNIDSRDQCNFKGTGDRVNTDPLLGPLQANGGLTQTMAPAAASPAVDQGAAFGLTTDQRAVVRPIDLPTIPNSTAAGSDGSDIGAVELQPSNAFTFGKVKKNKKKGTATLVVKLPQPSAGTLTLKGKGLKPQTIQIAGQAEVKLKIAAKSKAIKKALRKKGKRKVKADVTYTPTGNTAATQSKTTKLVKKKKKKRKKKRK